MEGQRERSVALVNEGLEVSNSSCSDISNGQAAISDAIHTFNSTLHQQLSLLSMPAAWPSPTPPTLPPTPASHQGLFPRAGELLKLGGSVFLAFVPFILAISLLFGGIYAVMGDHFVHGGDSASGPPAYVDPETLLSEPTVDPYIPYIP